MRTPAPDVYAPDLPAPRRGSGRQRRITSFHAPSSEPWLVKGKTHADKVIAFIEAWCRVPSGNGHGQPVKLRPWQKRLIKAVYGSSATPNRAAVVSLPRGNGKTSLAAFMAVAELYLVPAAEVLTVAASMRQALIAYGKAARMIEMSPELAAHAIVYANKSEPSVVLPARSSRMEPLPAEEKSLQGFAPTFCVVDEVGFIEPGTYTAMQSASGKHARSLVLGIGTPGYDKGLMYGMRERALSPEPPPRFVYVEFAAEPGDDIKDKRAWKRANPALGDFLQPDALALDVATLPPAVFRTFRLGQWADRVEQWIPSDVWNMLPIVPGLPPEGSVITLGFDGSVSIDSTGLVGYDIATQRLFVLAS